MKKLVINSGYMSSYQAIDTARNIPGPIKRIYLSKKYGQKRNEAKMRRDLKKAYQESVEVRTKEL